MGDRLIVRSLYLLPALFAHCMPAIPIQATNPAFANLHPPALALVQSRKKLW